MLKFQQLLDEFHAQLSLAWKKFYNLRASSQLLTFLISEVGYQVLISKSVYQNDSENPNQTACSGVARSGSAQFLTVFLRLLEFVM